MSNTQNVPPGLMQPTMASLPPGAGNPRDAAIISQQNSNNRQVNANAIGGRRRKYRGGADDVAVPQFQMQYTPTGGPGTNPNNQITGLSSTSMQSTAWATQDNQATKMGGSRKKRRFTKGGFSDWNWGCYSGGKRRTKRNRSHKKRNKRKTRQHRRH